MRRILALPLLVYPLAAQAPRVGDIDFYGLHKTTAAEILKVTGLEPGGALPLSKGDLEEKLEALPNVVEARVEAVCCQGDRTAIFIGIEEKGEPHAAFRSDPAGEAALPEAVTSQYQQFLNLVQRASVHGALAEDLTAGHSMMNDPAARALQNKFIEFANQHLDVLRSALHESPEPDTRAAAAALIGYGPKNQTVLNELQFAMDDPDAAVRANAMRSLSAFVVYAQKHPESGLKIEPTWLVELLHSVNLSDREQAAKTLLLVTDPNAPAAMRQSAVDLIRERALPALTEMARWPTLTYALPPFLLTGRVVGMPETEVQQDWAKGDRDAVIQKARDLEEARNKRSRK